MSSQGRPGTRYITPIDSNGNPVTEEGKGRFTLSANSTFHFVGGADEAPFASFQLVGYTAAGSQGIVTSATVRSCNLRLDEVPNQDLTAGQWIPENPGRVTCNTEGANWTQLNGVGASTGSNPGGLFFHICEGGQARTKLTVVIGATGGVFSCAGHGKR